MKAKGINATFFLLGKKNVTRFPQLVRREAAEGHEVANHTWTHPRLTELSESEIRRQLVLLQERVKELTGHSPSLMRPPQGLTNPRVAEVCRSLGLAQILWTVTANDYRDHDPAVIKTRVLQGAQRNGTTSCTTSAPARFPPYPASSTACAGAGSHRSPSPGSSPPTHHNQAGPTGTHRPPERSDRPRRTLPAAAAPSRRIPSKSRRGERRFAIIRAAASWRA
ncbi:polysaccharide deacetylase family protein [Streptomyces sp. MB09-01]|uniref:polysaccharide deacetylase family protein n=1 Tax=Streptomyces sp. MB09-01 TaxID=3028666 RepID=UPI0029A2943E|nr:polysaccharide deacetylase family protein [Streptomyces sp. MB09-01]MDX3539413.1 polysaccharide deacetylase family protein [Streptomyces sp. MB09-01]